MSLRFLPLLSSLFFFFFSSQTLSLSLSRTRARAFGRHPVAFHLYLSATGRLLVAQPLYIKRQGACYSAPPFSRDAGLARRREATGVSIVRVRGSVSKSIPCRRAAFYLRHPLPSAPSVRSLFASSFSSPIRFRLFRPFLQPLDVPLRLRHISTLSSFPTRHSAALPSFRSAPCATSDGRWLLSCVLLPLNVTRFSSFSFAFSSSSFSFGGGVPV